jgi:hypothetical protein
VLGADLRQRQTKEATFGAASVSRLSVFPSGLHSSAPASLPIATAIAFALFTEPILVQARLAKLATDVAADRPFASLAITAAIALAALAKPIPVFAGEAQFFALPATSTVSAIINPDPARSDLNGRLRESGNRKNKKGRYRCKGEWEQEFSLWVFD